MAFLRFGLESNKSNKLERALFGKAITGEDNCQSILVMLTCPRLSLQNLPHLVFDRILHFLDVTELVTLSQTCKGLQPVVYRVLYGQASRFCNDLCSRPNNFQVRIPNRFLFLEECISLNPQNATYLREYSAYTLERLEHLLPQVPLTLRLLDIPLPVDWFQDTRFEQTVSKIHVDTIVEEITAVSAASIFFSTCILNESEKLAYFVIPSVLHHFRGLKKFTITIPSDYLVHGHPINPATIINHVNCPRLEHLVFNGPGAKGIAYPSKSLSNLKYLEIKSELLDSCFPQFPHATWTNPSILLDCIDRLEGEKYCLSLLFRIQTWNHLFYRRISRTIRHRSAHPMVNRKRI